MHRRARILRTLTLVALTAPVALTHPKLAFAQTSADVEAVKQTLIAMWDAIDYRLCLPRSLPPHHAKEDRRVAAAVRKRKRTWW